MRRLLMLVMSLAVVAPTLGRAADNANRVLLGNKAVQRELKLSEEQQAKLDAILEDIEAEIQAKLKDAKVGKPDDRREIESEIADAVVARHGTRMQAVLNQEQAIRDWQIGAQASGPAVFNNNRTRRVLQLTPQQLAQMAELSEKMIKEVTSLATNVDKSIAEVKQGAAAAEQNYYQACLALLTAKQRQDFVELLGKPFDQELLSRLAGKKPRSMTFVSGLTGQNQYALVNIPDTRQQLALTDAQASQLQALLKKSDADLTEVRLRVLKSTEQDFAELELDEQRRLVKVILEGAAAIQGETRRKVWQILDAQQREVLDKTLVRLAGARSIESESIASMVKLTADQKAGFAKLMAAFEQKASPLRVVRAQRDFDHETFDKLLAELESAIRALLTPEQLGQLEAMGK